MEFAVGPIYCETLSVTTHSAVLEPINTVTNLAIFIAGFAALYLVRKYRAFSFSTIALIFLLFATAVGSTWWHAVRSSTALFFDATPGALFLLLFTFFWIYALSNRFAGYMGVAAYLLVNWVLIVFAPTDSPRILSLIFFGVTTITGLFLTTITYRQHGWYPTLWAALAIVFALAAAASRVLDLPLCGTVPFGTHFLWHIFLSLGAFCAIGLLVCLQKKDKHITHHEQTD